MAFNPIFTYSSTILSPVNGSAVSKSVNVANILCTVPNVVTPNDDNANDELDLSGLDVANLQIYNRWGRMVYEKINYTNEWRGQNMHDGFLPDATYYYIIFFKTGSEKEGWLLLSKG